MKAPKKAIKLSHRKLLFIVIALFAAIMYGQYAVINQLNSALEEKQRQVSGLQSYNQTLQLKMRRMMQTGNTNEFYMTSQHDS